MIQYLPRDFDVLYADFEMDVSYTLIKLGVLEHDRKDVFQEVWIGLFKRLQNKPFIFTDTKDVRRYIIKTTRNASISYRRRKRTMTSNLADVTEIQSPSLSNSDDDALNMLEDINECLTERYSSSVLAQELLQVI